MKEGQGLFLEVFPVSHETAEKLTCYEMLLNEWNEKFNLVAASTLPLMWSRHFLDSAQLMSYIPDRVVSVADMGAGAGFPGIVLAILAQGTKRLMRFHEIESTGKKADFLQAVIDRLGLDVVIVRDRVENLRHLKVDLVTARALKALPELLKLANHLIHKDSICVFPKGKALSEELTHAEKYWTFDKEIHPSRSDESGSVLVLSNLRYKSRRH
jgi:16S rRNA (guanine527-N7)-methyltransferase